MRSVGAFVGGGAVVCGAVERVSEEAAEEREGLRVGRVGGGCDEPAVDTRLDCADGVMDALEVADGGRVVEGGRAGAPFTGEDGFAAAARRCWSVVGLELPTDDILAGRVVVWETPPLDGRGLAPGVAGFGVAALGAAGRAGEKILVTLSRAANNPCMGGHWK